MDSANELGEEDSDLEGNDGTKLDELGDVLSGSEDLPEFFRSAASLQEVHMPSDGSLGDSINSYAAQVML